MADIASYFLQTFSQLPEELYKKFQAAVDLVDFYKALDMTEKIREQNALLADALAGLVQVYQFDAVQRLFKKGEA